MSTRSVFQFVDSDGSFSVYKHHDGYPSGAAIALELALAKAWPLPRFEADEFAAAFVAANKDGPGSIRLTTGPDAHGDLEYVYTLRYNGDSPLMVETSRPDGNDVMSVVGRCSLITFIKKYKEQ